MTKLIDNPFDSLLVLSVFCAEGLILEPPVKIVVQRRFFKRGVLKAGKNHAVVLTGFCMPDLHVASLGQVDDALVREVVVVLVKEDGFVSSDANKVLAIDCCEWEKITNSDI